MKRKIFDRIKLANYAKNNYSEKVVINDMINIYKQTINKKRILLDNNRKNNVK